MRSLDHNLCCILKKIFINETFVHKIGLSEENIAVVMRSESRYGRGRGSGCDSISGVGQIISSYIYTTFQRTCCNLLKLSTIIAAFCSAVDWSPNIKMKNTIEKLLESVETIKFYAIYHIQPIKLSIEIGVELKINDKHKVEIKINSIAQ